ncbi:MAG: hypothetical protein WBW84_20725, partial [Acidobacteriaceae bacterium]
RKPTLKPHRNTRTRHTEWITAAPNADFQHPARGGDAGQIAGDGAFWKKSGAGMTRFIPKITGTRSFHVQMTLEVGLANVRVGLQRRQQCMARVHERIKDTTTL